MGFSFCLLLVWSVMAAFHFVFGVLHTGHTARSTLARAPCLSHALSVFFWKRFPLPAQHQNQNQIWSAAHSITYCGLGGCQRLTFLSLWTNPDSVLMLPALQRQNGKINQPDTPKRASSRRTGRIVSAARVKRDQLFSSCRQQIKNFFFLYICVLLSVSLGILWKHYITPFFLFNKMEWTEHKKPIMI